MKKRDMRRGSRRVSNRLKDYPFAGPSDCISEACNNFASSAYCAASAEGPLICAFPGSINDRRRIAHVPLMFLRVFAQIQKLVGKST